MAFIELSSHIKESLSCLANRQDACACLLLGHADKEENVNHKVTIYEANPALRKDQSEIIRAITIVMRWSLSEDAN